jgi:hypothetical protein
MVSTSEIPGKRIIESENQIGDGPARGQLVGFTRVDFGESGGNNFVKSVIKSKGRLA